MGVWPEIRRAWEIMRHEKAARGAPLSGRTPARLEDGCAGATERPLWRGIEYASTCVEVLSSDHPSDCLRGARTLRNRCEDSSPENDVRQCDCGVA